LPEERMREILEGDGGDEERDKGDVEAIEERGEKEGWGVMHD
jgi:hypothetical protein